MLLLNYPYHLQSAPNIQLSNQPAHTISSQCYSCPINPAHATPTTHHPKTLLIELLLLTLSNQRSVHRSLSYLPNRRTPALPAQLQLNQLSPSTHVLHLMWSCSLLIMICSGTAQTQGHFFPRHIQRSRSLSLSATHQALSPKLIQCLLP